MKILALSLFDGWGAGGEGVEIKILIVFGRGEKKKSVGTLLTKQ